MAKRVGLRDIYRQILYNMQGLEELTEEILMILNTYLYIISDNLQGLEELAEEISTDADCGWQLRLYSYDSRTAGSDVYKVGWVKFLFQTSYLRVIYVFIRFINVQA